MKTFFRTVAAVVVGLVAALILVIGVEMFSAVVHPLPEGFGETMDEMCQHVARYPTWVLAVVVPMWGFTAFVSTWIAQWIGNKFAAATIGLLLLAAAGFNVAMLPYPAWFKIASLLAIPVAIIAAWRLPPRTKTTGANA